MTKKQKWAFWATFAVSFICNSALAAYLSAEGSPITPACASLDTPCPFAFTVANNAAIVLIVSLNLVTLFIFGAILRRSSAPVNWAKTRNDIAAAISSIPTALVGIAAIGLILAVICLIIAAVFLLMHFGLLITILAAIALILLAILIVLITRS